MFNHSCVELLQSLAPSFTALAISSCVTLLISRYLPFDLADCCSSVNVLILFPLIKIRISPYVSLLLYVVGIVSLSTIAQQNTSSSSIL